MNETVADLGKTCLVDFGVQFSKDFLSMFYLMSMNETTKDSIHDVPNYEVMLFPVIGIFIMTEQVIRLYQSKDLSRFEDCVSNVGSAFIFTLARVFLYLVVIELFDYIHTHYAIVHLPLHSPWTWLFSLLMVEFVYYWTHRALHEFNILWAAHQFHHMAEDINITTTVRDSIVDLVIYDIFPIPLAFILPAQILAVHIQFSLIYQVWLHNDVVGHLGPLEYIINTPRQHRVHHGKNPYCIDKNYGALLMIWDRMFGTYQTEKEDEKIIFGVVSPTPKTFDPMILQFGYYKDVWDKFRSVSGFKNKLYCLIKGPGWSPGKPRLGLISDVPQPDPDAPRYTYTPLVQVWKKVYIYVHSIIIVIGFYLMADHPFIRFSPIRGLWCMLYVIYTLTSFGAIFDNRWFSEILEISRCVAYFVFDYYFIYSLPWTMGPNVRMVFDYSVWCVRIFHVFSVMFWIANLCVRMCVHGHMFNITSSESSDDIVKKVPLDNHNGEMTPEEKSGALVDLMKVADAEMVKAGMDRKNNAGTKLSWHTAVICALLLIASVVVYVPIYAISVPSCNRLAESL